MIHQCYYCEQLFETKEKLYDHLEEHSKTVDEQKKAKKKKLEKALMESGNSNLNEDEIMEQFNNSKSNEPSRMSSRPKSISKNKI